MKKLRIGIFGCGSRGLSLGKEFLLQKDCEVVALCEQRPEREEPAREVFGKDCLWFDNFDEFIKQDLDAVLLTNYFNEHAPYAKRCFEKGKSAVTDGEIRVFKVSNKLLKVGSSISGFPP